MSLTLAGATLIGSAIGGASNLIGQGANMAFQASENQKNRAWQEKMSNTAYQRTVKDMEKAGLNKHLAYGANPANATASASGSNASFGGADFSSFGASALESEKLSAKREYDNASLNLRQQELDVRQGYLDLERQKMEMNNAQQALRTLQDNRTGFGR